MSWVAYKQKDFLVDVILLAPRRRHLILLVERLYREFVFQVRGVYRRYSAVARVQFMLKPPAAKNGCVGPYHVTLSLAVIKGNQDSMSDCILNTQ